MDNDAYWPLKNAGFAWHVVVTSWLTTISAISSVHAGCQSLSLVVYRQRGARRGCQSSTVCRPCLRLCRLRLCVSSQWQVQTVLAAKTQWQVHVSTSHSLALNMILVTEQFQTFCYVAVAEACRLKLAGILGGQCKLYCIACLMSFECSLYYTLTL